MHDVECIISWLFLDAKKQTYSAVRLGIVGNDVGQINEVVLCRARLILGWVTVSGSTTDAGNLSPSNHPGQLSLAIPPGVGAMSTSQRAVMLCSWEVKAGMARVWWQVKLCEPLYNVSYLSALDAKFRVANFWFFYSGTDDWGAKGPDRGVGGMKSRTLRG